MEDSGVTFVLSREKLAELIGVLENTPIDPVAVRFHDGSSITIVNSHGDDGLVFITFDAA
jgi:hypothetical protein